MPGGSRMNTGDELRLTRAFSSGDMTEISTGVRGLPR